MEKDDLVWRAVAAASAARDAGYVATGRALLSIAFELDRFNRRPEEFKEGDTMRPPGRDTKREENSPTNN